MGRFGQHLRQHQDQQIVTRAAPAQANQYDRAVSPQVRRPEMQKERMHHAHSARPHTSMMPSATGAASAPQTWIQTAAPATHAQRAAANFSPSPGATAALAPAAQKPPPPPPATPTSSQQGTPGSAKAETTGKTTGVTAAPTTPVNERSSTSDGLQGLFSSVSGQQQLRSLFVKQFETYKELLDKDRHGAAASPTWLGHHSEHQQLAADYQKLTRNYTSWPKTLKEQGALVDISRRLDVAIEDYKENELKIQLEKRALSVPAESAAKREPAPGEMWQSRATKLFAELPTLYRQTQPDKNPVDKAFLESTAKLSEIYSKREWHADPRMMHSVLSHWERAVADYKAHGQKAADSHQSTAPRAGFFDQAALALSSTIGVLDYRQDITDANLRGSLIRDSRKLPAQRLTTEQLEAALFIDSRMKDLAGQTGPGEQKPYFNYADVDAIASAVVRSKMANPARLAEEAIADQGFNPKSEEARGIRMALKVPGSELTAQERSDLARGARLEARLNGRSPILPSVREGLAAFRKAKEGLSQVEQLSKEIPAEIHKRTVKGLIAALEGMGVAPSHHIDQTPRNITEDDLRKFDTSTRVLMTIGKEQTVEPPSTGSSTSLGDTRSGKVSKASNADQLSKVEQLTGREISTVNRRGLSQDTIRGLVDAAIMVEPPRGLPPDVDFDIQSRERRTILTSKGGGTPKE